MYSPYHALCAQTVHLSLVNHHIVLLFRTILHHSKPCQGNAWKRLQEVTGLFLYYQLFPGTADVCARTLMICPVCDVL